MKRAIVTEKIWKALMYASIALVLFSSLISEEMRIKGEQLGASGQIAKPEMNELVDFLDSVLFSI